MMCNAWLRWYGYGSLVGILAITACSDDGLPSQGLNGTGSTGSDSPLTAADDAGVDDGDDGIDSAPPSTDSLGDGTTGGPAQTGTDGSSSTDAESSSSTDAESSSSTDAESSSSTDAESSSSTDAESSSSSDTATCEPITDDASALGDDCLISQMCPEGYTCQPFVGFQFQMLCQILCEQDCDCPSGYTCQEFQDKTPTPWYQCM